MPADSPPSLLITPDLRRRLQQRHEEANRLSAQPRPDFHRIHELLAECLRADPGNILYLDALLANLRRRNAADRGQSWLARWLSSWTRKGGGSKPERKQANLDENPPASSPNSAQRTQYGVLNEAADLLWHDPADVYLLRTLATAAGDRDYDEAELRYLMAARDVAPDDPETLRMLARALTRQGRFEDAVGPWFAVLALAPEDSEAAQATHDLRGVSQGASTAISAPNDAKTLINQARSLQDAGDFAAAEQCLARAQAASGADLELIHLREELRLSQSEHRLMIARRRAASDPHPKAQSLVTRLAEEHNRLEIEILNMQVERLPRMAEPRIELARRLKRAGNFSGAIQRLEEALRLVPNEPAALIVLGECWQHLRQFARALEIYEQAVAQSELIAPTGDVPKLARYRAAVLAAALGQTEFAREHFGAILAADPEFKDSRERLDKLGSN